MMSFARTPITVGTFVPPRHRRFSCSFLFFRYLGTFFYTEYSVRLLQLHALSQ